MLSHFFLRAVRKLKLLPKLNLKGNTEVNGRKFVIPIMGGLGFENLYLSEPWMTRLLLKLKPFYSGAFIDVGANVGQTLLKVYSIHPTANYYGFEPNPTCNYYLQQLSKLNNLQNCKLLPIGLSDNSGVLKLNFFSSHETDSTASIINNFRPTQPVDHSTYVPVFEYRHLRALLPEMGHCLLKIDVEGAELEVMKTMNEWIVKCQPLMIVEILPVYTADNEFRLSRQHEIEQLINSWNYRIARVNKDSISLSRIPEIGIHGDIEACDYVLYPTELEPGLSSLIKQETESKTQERIPQLESSTDLAP